MEVDRTKGAKESGMNVEILKRNMYIRKLYSKMIRIMRAYFPRLWARFAYYIAYGNACGLKNPRTFSEKLLWLSLNTYRNNPLIMQLIDKYLVRDYVKEKAGEKILNELYDVWESPQDIRFEDLPNSFALKVSQGCGTNIFCENKANLDPEILGATLHQWDTNNYLYDRMIANIGGVPVKQLKKYYICEKYLLQEGVTSPIDYKIYCFNGVPRAILVIRDRYGEKNGAFMAPDWSFISNLGKGYQIPDKPFTKPKSLNKMIEIAAKLGAPFPFVRVDLYDILGEPIFGELTFFPSGCIGMQETDINGISMGDMLDISAEMSKKGEDII